MRRVAAGCRSNAAPVRTGRSEKVPPQFGQMPLRTPSTQSAQKVHSNEQMNTSDAAADVSVPQHSQQGRISSISDAGQQDDDAEQIA